MKKIMIIGGGKLGFAIAQGFLNAEIEKSNLLVVCRSAQSREKFSELGIPTTNFIMGSHLKAYETVFLVVRPQDVGNAIVQLKGARSEFTYATLPENNIISVVSGLSVNVLSDYSGIHPRYITTATMNTNVAHNCGLITFTKFPDNKMNSEEILKKLGLIEKVAKYQDVLSRVTTIGSMNALDSVALKWTYKKYFIDHHFSVFLEHVENQLKTGKVTEMDIPLQDYIIAKTVALKSFSKQYVQIAEKTAIDTLLSTVVLLKKSAISIKDHIKTVVTPNGCTEKGINNIPNLKAEAILAFLIIVNKRAKKFYVDIKHSCNDSKLEILNVQKTQKEEALSKIYGRKGGRFVEFPV